MDANAMDVIFLGTLAPGFALGLSAIGSAIGMGIAGTAAIGGAKRCLKGNRPVPMLMLTFVGFPLTQIIYGFIIMQQMMGITVSTDNAGQLFGFGVASGLAVLATAAFQGQAGAAACDSLSDTGKGMAFYIAILGIIETIALFTMVFTITNIG
ncbi:MAG: V-type ATP synthase subunit K [Lachnospiraceae bacterium]|jgi:V/A-type H+-transporting ATPase subunit K|nr:V-type ATP synthase subunit K [Lachnospiraceae bacterium]